MKTVIIRHRIDDILSCEGLYFPDKIDALVKLHDAEKAKTVKLSDAGYRIKKLNLLRSLIYQAMLKALTDKYKTP